MKTLETKPTEDKYRTRTLDYSQNLNATIVHFMNGP